MSELSIYADQRDWLGRFSENPAELSQAAQRWYESVRPIVEEICDVTTGAVSRELVPEMPIGFRELTDLLCLWCDLQSQSIDPSPLQELCRYLEARQGDVYIDISSDICFDLAPDQIRMAFVNSRDLVQRIQLVADNYANTVEAISSLNANERDILQAMDRKPGLTAEELAEVAGYHCNSHFKTTCSSLVKREYARSRAPGYVITSKGRRALLGQSQD